MYQKVQAQEVDNYTQDAVDAATATLQDSIDNLKKAELPVKTVIIIAAIACGVLFIAVVTLAILLAVLSKRCKKLSEEQGNQWKDYAGICNKSRESSFEQKPAGGRSVLTGGDRRNKRVRYRYG